MLQASKMSSIPTRMPHHQPQGYGGPPSQTGRSPSKLQLMQQQMQQRHMREKEQKMQEYQYRNQNQNNSYQMVGQHHPETELGPGEAGTVRKFFQERRELSDQNGYGHNINHHYKQVKQGGYQYQTNGNASKSQVRNYGAIHDQRSNKYGRPPLPSKQSAGRDKSHPLAPIDRTPKQTPNGSRQSSRKSSAQSGYSHVNTFNGKARPVRRGNQEPVPYESDAEQYQGNAEDNGIYSNRSNTNSPKKKSTSFRDWQEKQKKIRQASAGQIAEPSSVPVQDFGSPNDEQEQGRKLSDFEKWQLEQDKQKQDRLQKHREQNGHISNRSDHKTSRRDVPSGTKPAYSPQSKKKKVPTATLR